METKTLVAVFYDRKNKQEVRADQLVPINFVDRYLVVDSEEFSSGKWQGHNKHPAYIKEEKEADYGYKSKNCPTYNNWDLHLKETDLVFLRLE